MLHVSAQKGHNQDLYKKYKNQESELLRAL